MLYDQILKPLADGNGYRFVDLCLTADGRQGEGVAGWLASFLSWEAPQREFVAYLRAEAGKGKSTALAHAAFCQLMDPTRANRGPLALVLPLRGLPRGAGVSWDGLAGLVQAVGPSAGLLKAAIRAGLVVPLFDGLDEVSARYDPTTVAGVLGVMAELLSPDARLALSGRTTEGMVLSGCFSADKHLVLGLELPEGEAFHEYVRAVIELRLPDWPTRAAGVPEPKFDTTGWLAGPLPPHQQAAVEEWVLYTFDELGKDKSLFFVESLACLARTRQLQGNQALLVPPHSSPADVWRCQLTGAAMLAASLACVRERDKIASEVRDVFRPEAQLDALTWFAVLSSTDDASRDDAGTPDEFVHEVFGVDPVNSAEDFVEIRRQMQKHALLYARGEEIAANRWRPDFLSDWLRAALLVRAWWFADDLPGRAVADPRPLIVRAQKARLAFEYLFPEWVGCGGEAEDRVAALVGQLVAAADAGSPEATANFWALVLGLARAGSVTPNALPVRPARLAQLTDLSGMEFEGLDFGPTFGGDSVIAVGAAFLNCRFSRSEFVGSDFAAATFVDCALDRVRFRGCTGPIRFEGCDFRGCEVVDANGSPSPVLQFTGCQFLEGCRVHQGLPAHSGMTGRVQPVVQFVGCSADRQPQDLLTGDCLYLRHPTRVEGLSTGGEQTVDPAVAVLVRVLRTFFPTWVANAHQARPYIRLSAIGRGVMPIGSPTVPALLGMLKAFGFVDGGRADHLYAPWSGVGGNTNPALRDELSAFMRDTSREGTNVTDMLRRVRRLAGW